MNLLRIDALSLETLMPQFSLQTALNVRERVERLKQKAFAEQLQVSQKIKNQIETIQKESKLSAEQLSSLKQQGFTITQLQFYGQYQKRLEQQIMILESQLKEQNEIVEVKQQELLKATQNRRVLEILKEKELQRFWKKQDRLERIEMDEIAQNFSINQPSE